MAGRKKLKCHCGKAALYHVYKFGFCREHYEDGVKAQSKCLQDQKKWAIVNSYKKY